MQKMEYHIISGKVIETRRCWMPDNRSKRKVRGQKVAGSTSEQKIKANEREAVRKLGRILNTNFADGLLFVTLKYEDEYLPADYEELKKNASKFLRKLRSIAPDLHYVMVNANWSPRKHCKARLHHHLIVPIMSMDMLAELWTVGKVYTELVRNPNDLTTLAAYLVDNVHDLPAGRKKWTTSKGMDKPIYTEPKPVEDLGAIQPIPNTAICEATNIKNEDGYVDGSYMRCITQERVKVRGGMVILPKKKKRTQWPAGTFEGVYDE